MTIILWERIQRGVLQFEQGLCKRISGYCRVVVCLSSMSCGEISVVVQASSILFNAAIVRGGIG